VSFKRSSQVTTYGMQYDHTETAPLYLILVGVGIAMLIGGWLTPELIVPTGSKSNQRSDSGEASGRRLCSGGAFSIRQFSVGDEGDRLLIAVEKCRSPSIHGFDVVQRRIDVPPRTVTAWTSISRGDARCELGPMIRRDWRRSLRRV
jgi:hypothetical protein